MRDAIRGVVLGACVAVVLAACVSAAKPRGPVDSFVFVAGTNKSLAENVVGTINPGTDPQEIRVVLPPGTDMHALVATLSLNKEAVITVISSGSRVVQENGITPNDFSVPVAYAVEVPGDKKPWGYKVFVREAETNAQLGILAVPPAAAMTPQFSPAVHAYSVQVPYAATSLAIRAGGQSRTLRSITVDGMVMPGTSGTATVAFESVQEKTVVIDCVAEDGVTKAQYTVTIQRAPPDTNSSLASLDLGPVALSPSFAPQQMSYQATVLFAAQQLVIRARPQSRVAAVTLLPAASTGSTAGSPMAFHGNPAERAGATVDLPPDQSFSVVVQVTAEDGSIQQYLLDITRAPPDHNADLASLGVSAGTLSPPFAPRIPLYQLALPSGAESVVITPAASSAVATVTFAGQPGAQSAGQGVTVPVAPGASSSVVFFVRAEDGFQRQYRVLVTRPQDGNALLGTLQLVGARIAPAFDSSIILYDVIVPPDAASFTLQVAAQSRYSAVAVEGRSAAGAPVTVGVPAAGRRTVVIDVTAQNGTVVRYTLRVAREVAAPSAPAAQGTAPATPAAPQPAPQPAPATQPTPAQQSSAPTQPAPTAQPPAAQPALTMPPDSGRDHVVVMTRGLKLGAREAAALAAAGDQPGPTARVTVRAYRAQALITQYPARVEPAAQGKEMVIAVNARSNGIALTRDGLVEVELAIPTRAGKFLYYTVAQPATDEVRVTVPFLLYGERPTVAWPAPGTMVPVGALASVLPPGKERAMDKEDFQKDAKGAVGISVQLLDPASGRSYGTANVRSVPGSRRDADLPLDQPILVPEGATVKYVLAATARSGKTWTAEGSAPAWTTEPAYPAGFQPVTLQVSDDLAPAGSAGGK
ncbi:MAG TPA: cadherin-like beta sandwich domain-containing protein [Spirochaetia bacterium]|nr:cadherin-like beta sandwich domain-containing protein [Spirochaetia bacterium]